MCLGLFELIGLFVLFHSQNTQRHRSSLMLKDQSPLDPLSDIQYVFVTLSLLRLLPYVCAVLTPSWASPINTPS